MLRVVGENAILIAFEGGDRRLTRQMRREARIVESRLETSEGRRLRGTMRDAPETSSRPRSPRRRAGALAFGAALVCAVVLPTLVRAPALIRGEVPLAMDPLLYFLPARVHAARLIARGEAPWWNRCMLGGAPLFSNPQSGLAYPLHWPSLLLTGDVSYDSGAGPKYAIEAQSRAWRAAVLFHLSMTLHLGLWAAAAGIAARAAGANRAGATWCVALALAGNHGWSRLQSGAGATLLPWPMFALAAGAAFARLRVRASRSRRARARAMLLVAAGGVAFGMAISAGAPQSALVGLLGGLSLIAWLEEYDPCRRGRATWFENLAYGGLSMATFALLVGPLGAALSAPGWLPQAAFLRQTSRADGLSREAAVAGAPESPLEILAMLAGPRGDSVADAESSFSLGWIALLLACVPPRAAGRARFGRRAWVGCWVIGILFASLSTRFVAGFLFDHVKGADDFHGPRRWLATTHAMLLIASGLGAGEVWRRCWVAIRTSGAGSRPSVSRGGRTARFLRLSFLPTALLGLATLADSTHRTTELSTIPLAELLAPEGRPPLIAGARLESGERFVSVDPARDSSYAYRRRALADLAVPNLGTLWGIEDFGGYEPGRARGVEEIFDATCGWPGGSRPWESHFALPFPPAPGSPAEARWPEAGVAVAILPQDGLPVYLHEMEQGRFGGAFPAISAPFEIVVRFYEVAGASSGAVADDSSPGPGEASTARGPTIDGTAPRLSLGGTGGEAIARELRENTPGVTADAGGFRVAISRAELPVAPPSAWLMVEGVPPGIVSRAFVWSDELSARWERIAESEALAGDASEVAVFRARGAAKPEWARFEPPATGARVVARTIRANSIELEVEWNGQAPEFLELREAWWPGWSAAIDGEPVELRSTAETREPGVPNAHEGDVAGGWRRIRLPAGETTGAATTDGTSRRRIVMRYSPPLLGLSLWIAAGGGAAVLALLAFGTAHRRTPELTGTQAAG